MRLIVNERTNTIGDGILPVEANEIAEQLRRAIPTDRTEQGLDQRVARAMCFRYLATTKVRVESGSPHSKSRAWRTGLTNKERGHSSLVLPHLPGNKQ